MGYQETYDRILQKREEAAVEKRKRLGRLRSELNHRIRAAETERREM